MKVKIAFVIISIFTILVLAIKFNARNDLFSLVYIDTPESDIPRLTFVDAKMPGIAVYYNVCIEDLATPILMVHEHVPYNETKKIVIFDSRFRTNKSKQINLGVLGNFAYPHLNYWKLEFPNITLPITHSFNQDTSTAFFTHIFCPANLHHFLIDGFRPLYAVMRLHGRLFPNARNQLVYRIPHDVPGFPDLKTCLNIHPFYPLLESLYIRPSHDVFTRFPSNVCFRKAVFGITFRGINFTEPEEHILNFFNLKRIKTSKLMVTIIQRSQRGLLNAVEMLQVVKDMPNFQGRIVDMGKLTVKQQLTIASSSQVLVGVNGAALAWSIFMSKGSHLIEIAWPQKHWNFFFEKHVVGHGIIYHPLVASDIIPNWPVFSKRERKPFNLTQAQKDYFLKTPPAVTYRDNLWKWADVNVNLTLFKDILNKIH